MQHRIFTVQQGDTVEQAQTLMAVNSIRHLPVLDGRNLVGILSEGDIRGVLIPQRVSESCRRGTSGASSFRSASPGPAGREKPSTFSGT
jgi:predicted transcriptional regulator